jgi:hypothetical protein
MTPRTSRLTASRNGFLARSTALSWPWNKDRLLATPGTLPPTFADLALGMVDCRKPVIRIWGKDPMQRDATVAPAQEEPQGSPPDVAVAALNPRLREDDGGSPDCLTAVSAQKPLQREDDDAGALPAALAQARAQGSPPDVGAAALDPRLREDDGGSSPMTASTENPVYREPRGPLRNGNPRGNPNLAPRCGARTRRTGCPCRAPAMRNGRCRLHGGKSTGPRTEEGRARIRAARLRHGRYTAESRAFQRDITGLLRRSRELLALARQPGPVDTEALRHLAPPELNKHPVQRGNARQRPVAQGSGPNPPPPKDHMQREHPVAGPPATTPRMLARGSAFTVISTHRPTPARVGPPAWKKSMQRETATQRETNPPPRASPPPAPHPTRGTPDPGLAQKPDAP